jgi:hypothetical protein
VATRHKAEEAAAVAEDHLLQAHAALQAIQEDHQAAAQAAADLHPQEAGEAQALPAVMKIK